MILLINATPAKEGGAKTILENYLAQGNFDEYKKIILLAPRRTEFYSNKVVHIPIETKGLHSYFFSVLFVMYFALKFRVDKIISFNNVNLIVGNFDTVTYFHNVHIFYANSLRFKLFRFTISHLMKNHRFVVQSNYVRNEFINVFGSDYNVITNWPGCQKPIFSQKTTKTNKKIRCLVPITDSSSIVKNFSFVVNELNFLTSKNIEIVTLDSKGPESEIIDYKGMLDKKDLWRCYSDCDLMLMPSLFESVGLPIFEFAASGKPVLVLDKPYIHGIKETIGLTSNIIIFDGNNFHTKIIDALDNYRHYRIDELSDRHPYFSSDWTALN
ncbi:hypothetical protein BCT04_16795 [Vibrio breoganii]|uniref:glycosyltransferase n=1 Tax=Vibrio breoganii TaxID=553239 RepID=UPI000C85A2D9|nr:glycosyltransferase [Vibrio breoganii]PMO62220.1 hypothetical protein BCT04_16795 [Vibrio breoganii]